MSLIHLYTFKNDLSPDIGSGNWTNATRVATGGPTHNPTYAALTYNYVRMVTLANSAWTVSFWHKGFPPALQFLWSVYSGHIVLHAGGGQYQWRNNASTVFKTISASDVWHHHAVQSNGSGTVKWWVDGVVQYTNTSLNLVPDRYLFGDFGNRGYGLTEVAIFDHMVSDVDIGKLANGMYFAPRHEATGGLGLSGGAVTSFTVVEPEIDVDVRTWLIQTLGDEWGDVGRIQEGFQSEDAVTPRIWYQRSGEPDADVFLGGELGIRTSEFDIEIYSEDIAETQRIARQIKEAIRGFRGDFGLTNCLMGEYFDHSDEYEPQGLNEGDEGLHLADLGIRILHL